MYRTLLIPLALVATAFGCVHVKVDPIVATVNVNLKVDRQLDEFFSYQNTTTQPSTPPAPPAPAVPVPTPTTIPNPESK